MLLKKSFKRYNMKEYLSKFITLTPADWSGQYFPKQIIYQNLFHMQETGWQDKTVAYSISPGANLWWMDS